MRASAMLENMFYHGGKGLEQQRVYWGNRGVELRGFEYYNPDDEYIDINLKHRRWEANWVSWLM